MVLVGPTVPVSAEINPGIEEVVPPEPESDNGSVVPEPENLPVESDDSILDGANPIPDVDGIIIGE